MMKILGIDPGTATTGWAAIKTDGRKIGNKKIAKVLGCGIISTTAKMPDSDRLEIIFDSLCAIIKKEKPDIVAVEELFFFKNVKTVMSVSQTRGVVLLAVKKSKMPCAEFTPLQVKQAVVGYGRADKNQVQEMMKEILHLKSIPKPDDAADALAIALCCAQTNEFIK
jgi:crossover junction endodeoxyribonuclease RuvC